MQLNEVISVRFPTMERAIKLTIVTERRIWRAKLVTQRTGRTASVTLGDHLEMLQKKKEEKTYIIIDCRLGLLN